jgi:chromosome segregation ATPase
VPTAQQSHYNAHRSKCVLQSLKSSLAEANRRAKDAEDELHIVQRQMERMRETLSPGAPAAKLGAVLEENHTLKDIVAQLKQQVRYNKLMLRYNGRALKGRVAAPIRLQTNVVAVAVANGVPCAAPAMLTTQVCASRGLRVAVSASIERLRAQVIEVEELLAQAERKASALQADKERLLSMVSRLELDKHRLESARTPVPQSQPAGTPQAEGQASRCGAGLVG